jgi:hypothetical protein
VSRWALCMIRSAVATNFRAEVLRPSDKIVAMSAVCGPRLQYCKGRSRTSVIGRRCPSLPRLNHSYRKVRSSKKVVCPPSLRLGESRNILLNIVNIKTSGE